MQISSTVAERNPRQIRGLVLSKYDVRAASTRQRILQVMPYLTPLNIELQIEPLFDNAYLEDLFLRGKRSLSKMARAYWRRFTRLRRCKQYDFIWVQYELFPYLPGLFEALIGRCGKPIILDYDDAIFHQYDLHPNPLIRRLLAHKLKPLLTRASLAFCGNTYLRDYVMRYCKHTELVPTVVDVTHYVPRQQKHTTMKPTLGWIGSPSTFHYVKPMAPMLANFMQKGDLDVVIIGAGPAADKSQPFLYRDWVEAEEITEIQAMDIGIMPIPDEPWARGKCGYKLIQYMACGIPVIASPVGVNREIVTHGVNGFLASTPQEWSAAIQLLLEDPALRARMGAEGRKTVEARYSIQQYGPNVAHSINKLLRS